MRLKCGVSVDYSDRSDRGPGASGPVQSESERVHGCGSVRVIAVCEDDGRVYSVPVRCRSRLCPHCARVRSMDWYHRLRGVRLRWPKLVTFTLPHGSDVAALVDLAHSAFARVRRVMPRAFASGVYALEVLPSKTTAGWWYVHIHVLVDGAWIDRPALVALWQSLTGAYIVDVRMVDRHKVSGAVLEVVKYITKPGGAGLTAAQVDALGAGVRYKRLTDVWGGLSLLDTQETSLQDAQSGTLTAALGHSLRCPHCGGRLRFAGFLPAAVCDVPDYTAAVMAQARARAGPAVPASC